jgi:hypothetical protein
LTFSFHAEGPQKEDICQGQQREGEQHQSHPPEKPKEIFWVLILANVDGDELTKTFPNQKSSQRRITAVEHKQKMRLVSHPDAKTER